MCHWNNRTCRVLPYDIHNGSMNGAKKSVLSYIIAKIRGYVYKMLAINSANFIYTSHQQNKKKGLIFQEICDVDEQQPNFQQLPCYHSLSSHKCFSLNK